MRSLSEQFRGFRRTQTTTSSSYNQPRSNLILKLVVDPRKRRFHYIRTRENGPFTLSREAPNVSKREGFSVIIANFPNLHHVPRFPLLHQLIVFQIFDRLGYFPLSHDNCGIIQSQDRRMLLPRRRGAFILILPRRLC